jgi:hypothetical protein
MNDEGVAAMLGLAILAAGGEIRIPHEQVEDGLPSDSAVRVYRDEKSDELVLTITKVSDAN